MFNLTVEDASKRLGVGRARVNQLIRRVDVYRGYQISVSFNFNLSQYFEGIDSTAC